MKASLRTASRPLIANPYGTNTKLLINTIARGKQRREKRTELRIRHQGRSSLECAFWSRRARGDVDGGKFFELPLRPLPVYYALPTRREAQDISFFAVKMQLDCETNDQEALSAAAIPFVFSSRPIEAQRVKPKRKETAKKHSRRNRLRLLLASLFAVAADVQALAVRLDR